MPFGGGPGPALARERAARRHCSRSLAPPRRRHGQPGLGRGEGPGRPPGRRSRGSPRARARSPALACGDALGPRVAGAGTARRDGVLAAAPPDRGSRLRSPRAHARPYDQDFLHDDEWGPGSAGAALARGSAAGAPRGRGSPRNPPRARAGSPAHLLDIAWGHPAALRLSGGTLPMVAQGLRVLRELPLRSTDFRGLRATPGRREESRR